MDPRLSYSQIAKTVLRDYADVYVCGGGGRLYPVFDDEHQSYLLLKREWQGKKYLHSTIIHLDVIERKIWVQQDHTEDGIATALLDYGVPRDDIVLGFRAPELRQYTEFAAVVV